MAEVVILGIILGYRTEGGATGVLLAVLLLNVFSSCLSWARIVLGLIMRTPKSLMAVRKKSSNACSFSLFMF